MSAVDTNTQKLNLVPGINKNTTELDAEGTYVCSDKVRFFYGKPEKIGGWQKQNVEGSLTGVARDLHTWVDLEEKKYLGIGTHQKLYLLNGGKLSDITPIVASACGSNVLTTLSGSSLVTVSVNPEGAKAGDFFKFADVTASAKQLNFDVNTVRQITSVGTGHFTFNASGVAISAGTGLGGITRVDYLLGAGLQSNGAGFGWGAGTWGTPGVSATGSAGWGKPRAGRGVFLNLRQWSLDNWGEDLLANPYGGKIYRWEASAGVNQRATLMSSAAPSINNIMLVAQEGRHVISFGTHTISGDYDPLLVRWSDSENYNTWTAAATNQAGEFRLENGSFIIGALESRKEILVFTDESVYSMRRVGGNAVFSFSDLGKHNGLMSKHAAVDVNGKPYWMAFNSFQHYDGVIHTLPCSMQKHLFSPDSPASINYDQKEKIFADTNREFNEITWFYPSKNSVENDRYITHNYLENLWYGGTLDRTVWADVDIFERPYGIDPAGTIYIHEQGKNADTAGMRALLQTSFFDLQDGDQMMFIDRYIPDNTITKELNVTFSYKKYPQSTEVFTKGPFKITPETRKAHPRIRGRQCQLTYSTSIQGGDFRLGSDRLTLKPDGER